MMAHRLLLLALLLPAGSAVALQAGAPGPWAQFRGPGGQGASAERGLPVQWSLNEGVAWKVSLAGPGISSPAVAGDRIYLTSYTPGQGGPSMLHVHCLNLANGSQVWKQDVRPRLPEQERIREDHGYASSTPAVDGERVYVFFGKSGLHAFDLQGKHLWQADLGSGLNGWGSSNSPVVYGDLVIVNASVESQSLIAVDRRTGKEAWRAGGIRESWNTPVIVPVPGGQPELVTAIFGKILGFEPRTGRQLWTCNTDIPWYMVPSLVHRDGIVYCIGGRTGGALAVRCGGKGDVTQSHRLWTGRKGSNVSSPVLHDGHLYWMHENLGVAYCADAKSGQIVYEERLQGAGGCYASPVLADGKIYYVSRGGRTAVVAATPAFRLLATNDLRDGGVFDASPAVARGKLLIRSNRTLYCIGR